MVLAAAEGAHAAVAGQRAEGLPVFDRAQVAGQSSGSSIRSARTPGRVHKPVDLGQGQEHGHDHRAGTAHAGGRRQVAGQGDVGAALAPRGSCGRARRATVIG